MGDSGLSELGESQSTSPVVGGADVRSNMTRAKAIEEIVVRIMQERSGMVERMTLQQWSEWLERLLKELDS